MLDGLEEKWSAHWEENGVYRFDPSRDRTEVFSIDTPPPTVSGSLHIGHVFSYTHTDIVARYQRMLGKHVFYPMGWDDNGLPTERRVENYFGVRCDVDVPYDADLIIPKRKGDSRGHYAPVSRRNFVELCRQLTLEDEQAFERLWRGLGLSIDWSRTYSTIDERSQRASQRAFLRNLARDEAYRAEAPCMWDVTYQTAVAQAELEDREISSSFVDLIFRMQRSGDPVVVATTRPELLAACVALVVNPEDPRYAGLVGEEAVTPLFGARVPVRAHRLAEPDKGTGIAMVCTFGDVTDVVWWRELGLPLRPILAKNGTISTDTPDWLSGEEPGRAFQRIAGLSAKKARDESMSLLQDSGFLAGEPRPITHAVKFYEKGDRPVEIVTTPQWYLRNGAEDSGLLAKLVERGHELSWQPSYMQSRYENWVNGLSSDWLVSRQRYFGVPFPVWYRLDGAGCPMWDAPIVPPESVLPIDPQSTPPPGVDESERGKAGGFMADPDVMDTWATSSLTPYIACGWEEDQALFRSTFPMDMRPQGHDIIRTWLFSSILRSELESGTLPWKHTVLSGWILDPDRKKMSKSKGNVVTPQHLVDKYGADGVRYWAALAKPGTDTAFDEMQMKAGRRLAIKILNASRFALRFGSESHAHDSSQITDALDRSFCSYVAKTVSDTTARLVEFDHASALAALERSFWSFCDFYLELAKSRAYREDSSSSRASARNTLLLATDVYLRCFAPYLPFVTEEVWSSWRGGTIHRESWPESEMLLSDDGQDVYTAAVEATRAIRAAKSSRGISGGTSVAVVELSVPSGSLALLSEVAEDVRDAVRTSEIKFFAATDGEWSALVSDQ